MKTKGDDFTEDIFSFLEPTARQIEEIPGKDKARDILILGWLNMFTNEFHKAVDRNKAGENIAKIYGLITDKKQIEHTIHTPKTLDDFYNE